MYLHAPNHIAKLLHTSLLNFSWSTYDNRPRLPSRLAYMKLQTITNRSQSITSFAGSRHVKLLGMRLHVSTRKYLEYTLHCCGTEMNSNCGTVSLSRNYSNNEYTYRIIIIRWSCTLFSNSNCGTVSLSRNYSNNEYTYRIIIIRWSCTLFSNSNCGTVSLSRNYSNNEYRICRSISRPGI